MENLHPKEIYEIKLSIKKGLTRDKDQIDKDFSHVDADLQFIPEERIIELLKSSGFTKNYKFYQSYLFGGYIAEKA